MSEHDQPGDDGRRAAQIRAARGVLIDWLNPEAHADLIERLVDAVNAAGHDDHDRFAGRTLQDPRVREAYARGVFDAAWTSAVAALRDDRRYLAWCDANPGYDGRRVWSLAARHGLADYLEAVGPTAHRKDQKLTEENAGG